MKSSTDYIKKQFISGLKEYLVDESEHALTEAYELGRNSLKRGLGELDLIDLYHEALSEIQSKDGALKSRHKFQLASAYLTDVLAPYEMRQSGYKELISRLNRKNDLLEKEIHKRKKSERALQKSKDEFQSLIENALDIITVFNGDGTIYYASPAVERVLAYTPEELQGEKVFGYLHPEEIGDIRHIVEDLNDIPGKVISSEFRFRHKKGDWVILENVAKNVADDENNPRIIVNSRDITDRVTFRRELEEKSRQLEEAQHIAHVGSWEWRMNEEKELLWSKEMCGIYGMEPEEFDYSFESYINRVHPDDRIRVKKIIDKALENKSAYSFEHRVVLPNGKERMVFGKGEVITDGSEEVTKLVGISQDITERKKGEERLRQYSERLRQLTAKVEHTREEERIRIAREIHDELGQMLTVLKMEFSMLIEKVNQNNTGSLYIEISEEKEQVAARIDTILKSVQRITTELRPEVLDDLGLKEAIEWQAREFGKRTGITMNFTSKIEHTNFLEEERSTAIFRIFQETLTNIARHAEATKVSIVLSREDDSLLLEVADDGIGISISKIESSGSLGIIGMRERAQLLGGDIQFGEGSEEGTTILLKMPIKQSV